MPLTPDAVWTVTGAVALTVSDQANDGAIRANAAHPPAAAARRNSGNFTLAGSTVNIRDGEQNGEGGGQALPGVTLVFTGILVTLILHFGWELLQVPAFAGFSGMTWSVAVHCFRAALGDVLIAGGAYAGAARAFRRSAWPVLPKSMAPGVTWIVLGLIATIAFEFWALRLGRWAYGEGMPLLFGVGLFPLLQWLVVPVVTLAILRQVAAVPSRPGDSGGRLPPGVNG